jgi:hypothetical protein
MENQNNEMDLAKISNFNDLSDHFGLSQFPYKDFLFMKIENEEIFFDISSSPLRHKLYSPSPELIMKWAYLLEAW